MDAPILIVQQPTLIKDELAKLAKQDKIPAAIWEKALGAQGLTALANGANLLINQVLSEKLSASLKEFLKKYPNVEVSGLYRSDNDPPTADVLYDISDLGLKESKLKFKQIISNERAVVNGIETWDIHAGPDSSRFPWVSKDPIWTAVCFLHNFSDWNNFKRHLEIKIADYNGVYEYRVGSVFPHMLGDEKGWLIEPWTEGNLLFDNELDLIDKFQTRDCRREPWQERWYFTLCNLLKNYFRATKLKGVTLGLSGGLDSAFVATLAVDALGPDQVTALFIPGKYTSDTSRKLARQQAEKLGIQLVEIPLNQSTDQWLKEITSKDHEGSIPEQNLTARNRAAIITSYANAKQLLVLATSNLSEILLGYFTLGGDSCGGYAPIADVPKTAVKKISRWRNQQTADFVQLVAPICEEIIARPPSAELAPNQTDEQDLGCSYEEIDYYLKLTSKQPANFKFDEALKDKLRLRYVENFFKRQHLPPKARITEDFP